MYVCRCTVYPGNISIISGVTGVDYSGILQNCLTFETRPNHQDPDLLIQLFAGFPLFISGQLAECEMDGLLEAPDSILCLFKCFTVKAVFSLNVASAISYELCLPSAVKIGLCLSSSLMR